MCTRLDRSYPPKVFCTTGIWRNTPTIPSRIRHGIYARTAIPPGFHRARIPTNKWCIRPPHSHRHPVAPVDVLNLQTKFVLLWSKWQAPVDCATPTSIPCWTWHFRWQSWCTCNNRYCCRRREEVLEAWNTRRVLWSLQSNPRSKRFVLNCKWRKATGRSWVRVCWNRFWGGSRPTVWRTSLWIVGVRQCGWRTGWG